MLSNVQVQRSVVRVRRRNTSTHPVRKVDDARKASLIKQIDTMPLYDYLCYWLRNQKCGMVKPTTYDTLERVVQNYIKDTLGGIPVGQLQPEDVQGLLSRMKEIDGYSHSTVKKVYDCLNASIKYGVKRRMLPENPMDLVEMPSKNLFATTEMTFFSIKECAFIIEEATRSYSTGRPVYLYGDAIVLILLTGIRLGEAIGLKKEDYDATKRTLKIRRNVQKVRNRDEDGNLLPGRNLQETTTKSYSGQREIPLTTQAAAAIERMLREHPYSEYIVCSSKGAMATPEQVDRTFRYLLRNLGLSPSGVHKLRHTFASLLFAKSIDVKTISKLLGHASCAITLSTYIHIADVIPHSAVTPLDELF